MTTVATLGSSQISSELSTVEARLEKPITNLNAEVTADKSVISAWGAISGSISTLSNSLAGISDVASINNRAVTSSVAGVATATAAIGGQTGTFSLTGVTLAKTQAIYSAVQGSAAAALAGSAGALTITLGSGKSETVNVASGSLTLNGVAAAINTAAGGVKASIIGTSTGARLVLQGSATGGSQSFSVAGTGGLAVFDYSSASAGTETRSQVASDASVTINGVPLTSKTNTLGSAVAGLSITLTGSGSTSIAVSSAPTALSAAVSAVAANLNAALSTIAKQTAYKPASGSSSATAGVLLGNYTATSLSNELLSAVSGAAASGVSANAIGLKVSSAGAVSFNSSAFATAFAAHPTAVQNLVSQIYHTLETIKTSAIGGAASTTSLASTGEIGAATTSLDASTTAINTQVAAITKQNNATLQELIDEYTIAENASTAASITQSYLDIFTSTSSSG